jgi:hypothetical protein
MKRIMTTNTLGVLAMVAVTTLTPLAALANHQSNKNLGRNIGIGGAAVGLYGLLHHNTTATIAGIAGAAAGAKMYEDNRKAQSRNHARYYHRPVRHYYWKNGHRYYRTY